MIKLLVILFISYIWGMICAHIFLRPYDQWSDGYNTAKKTYGNWNNGFETAWKEASELFKDYETGFGDGFEAGWEACEEQKGEHDG